MYTLDHPLGEGGAATVWLARAPGDHLVAMKFFPPIASSAEEFRKEASAMRQRHPNIVGLLDAGIAEDRSPYLVIEYVPGRDARTLLEEEAPEAKRALHIGAQVFSGLDALHRAGLIHGDIKPENIRLSQKEREARLVDFGRARLRHLFGTTKIFPGTPPYMLPSLFRGGAPTPRSDCFAAWIMVYELICGERPYTQGMLRAAEDVALPRRKQLPDADLEILIEAGLTGRIPDARAAYVAITRYLAGFKELPSPLPPPAHVEISFIKHLKQQLDNGRSLALVGDVELGRTVLEAVDRLWRGGSGHTLWARAEWLPPGTPLAGALSLAVQVSDSLAEHELAQVAAALGPLGTVLSTLVPATRAWLPAQSLPEGRPASERLLLALRRLVGACPRPLLLLVDGLDRLDGASRRFFSGLVAESELLLLGTTTPDRPHGMPGEILLPTFSRPAIGDASRLLAHEQQLIAQARVLELPLGAVLSRATGCPLNEVQQVALAAEAAGLARWNGVETVLRESNDPAPLEQIQWFQAAARRLDLQQDALLVARYAHAAGDAQRLGQAIDRAVEETLRYDPATALELLNDDPLPPTPARILRHFHIALLGGERAKAEALLARLQKEPEVSPADLAEAQSDLLFNDGAIAPALRACEEAVRILGVEGGAVRWRRLKDFGELLRLYLRLPKPLKPDARQARLLERLHDLYFLSDNAAMLYLHGLWKAAAPKDYRVRAMEVVWQSALGRHAEARRLEQNLLAEGEEERNPVAAGVVMLHRGIARVWRGETVDAFSDGVEAVERLVRVGDSYLASLAGSVVWTAGFHLGTHTTMRRVADSLKRLTAVTGDARGAAWVDGGLGVVSWQEGKIDEAIRYARTWAEHAAARGENTEALARRFLGEMYLEQGDLDRAIPEFEQTVALIQRFHLQMDYTDAVHINLAIADARLRRAGKPALGGNFMRSLRLRWLLIRSPRWTPRVLGAQAWAATDPLEMRLLFEEAEMDATQRHQEQDRIWVRKQRALAGL